jgi:hypothetical protein
MGTLSKASAAAPAVRDATVVRHAVESGSADEALKGIYALLNRAAANKDVDVGAAMIRRQLPPLGSTFVALVPTVRARVIHAPVATQAGREMRSLVLYVIDQETPLIRSLGADVRAR